MPMHTRPTQLDGVPGHCGRHRASADPLARLEEQDVEFLRGVTLERQ